MEDGLQDGRGVTVSSDRLRRTFQCHCERKRSNQRFPVPRRVKRASPLAPDAAQRAKRRDALPIRGPCGQSLVPALRSSAEALHRVRDTRIRLDTILRASTDLPVVPSCRRRAALIEHPNQQHLSRRPAHKRGVSRSSRTLVRDAMDAIASQDERRVCGRRSRVVLASRR
jgi:hypothetical protein